MKIFEIKLKQEFDIVPHRTSGEELFLCPVCSHTRKKKTIKCLSWNHNKELGRCNHCEASFVIPKELEQPMKQYVRPSLVNATSLSEKALQWFISRGIAQSTIQELKVSEGAEFMPQTGRQENCIQFNYFRGGELINIKYRDGKKNFKLVKDAELIPYNIDAVQETDTVIICEGEMDALSWHTAGHKNVISIPNGAGKKTQNLEWMDPYAEFLQNKSVIYLSTDDDEPGRALRDELARRLGFEKCLKVEFPGCKDANEYLMSHGKMALSDRLKEAKEFPMIGVFGVEDVWDDIMDLYHNGMPKGAKSGDRQFDEHLGCMPGELTMVTGIPSHGKSIYLDQISLGLCLNSEWKFGVCSPESFPMSFYFTRLIKRLVGKKFSAQNITPYELQQCKDWLSMRYHLINPEEGFTVDSVLEKARMLVVRKGIHGLILDPWNRIENSKPSNMPDGEWIVQCLIKIITFAQKHKVHVFLVAHPTKMQKSADGSNYQIPNLYSISGSAHFFNMTQNGFTVFRNYVTNMTEIHFQKVKWEHLGHQGIGIYQYTEENARFVEPGDDAYKSWLPQTKQDQLFDPQLSAIQPNLNFDTQERETPF